MSHTANRERLMQLFKKDLFQGIKLSDDPHSYERNFSNCAEKPELFSLLNAIAKIVFMTARIIASLEMKLHLTP